MSRERPVFPQPFHGREALERSSRRTAAEALRADLQEARAAELEFAGETKRASRVRACGQFGERTCKDRLCPACGARAARKNSLRMRAAVRRFAAPILVTVTLPTRRIDDLKRTLREFRRALQRWRRRGSVKRVIAAGIGAIEPHLARDQRCWAVHAHVVAEQRVQSHRLETLARAWVCVTGGRGRFLDDPNGPEVRSIEKLTAYVTKVQDWCPDPGQLPPEAFVTLLAAIRGARLLIRWGEQGRSSSQAGKSLSRRGGGCRHGDRRFGGVAQSRTKPGVDEDERALVVRTPSPDSAPPASGTKASRADSSAPRVASMVGLGEGGSIDHRHCRPGAADLEVLSGHSGEDDSVERGNCPQHNANERRARPNIAAQSAQRGASMTIEDEVRELFRSAVREVVVPELRSELARPLMLSIRQAPVPRYVILQAEKRGELNVFHVGREAFVAEAEMWEWIRRHGISRKQPRARDDRPPTERGDRQPTGRDEQSSAERDDVSAIVELGERRRRNRSKT